MIDPLPVDWMFNQHVPLIWFLIALLTHPATWAERGLGFLKSKAGGEE